ncbi:PepSY domain-containing protein [Pedobacter yulinensis]|uniref:PepSY domain-containing protein n=1 Tax=Pedobacter yulinensis TaxID=2126353 RepID=A0A2T3HI39_9SPHI|nr:PepSY-associated TM helix domain-containing protein [Pedobacter yulinensis]PST82063.1 PepSY domain-containing protein [Pedobacter yulinensis]
MSGRTFKQLAFRLHSWLGLVSGVFLLLLGLSGSAIVFFKEMDKTIHARLLRVQPAAPALSLDSVYQVVRSRQPDLVGMAWLNPDAAPDEALDFRLYRNDGKLSTYDLGLITVDPYSGKVLRQGSLSRMKPSLLHWILQFHWSFQLGIPGLLLATVFGLTMVLSVLTGTVIYRKYFWKVLTFRSGIAWKNWRTVSSGLHRLIGVWSLAFNLVIFFTGFWMNRFSFDPEYWKSQVTVRPPALKGTAPADQMLAAAKKAFPELLVSKVYLPVATGKSFKISGTVPGQSALFYNGNSVTVDPVSGRVAVVERLAAQSFFRQTEATFFQLHAGHFGGTPVKVLYVLLGLTPGLLSVTGALLWWRRLRSRRQRGLLAQPLKP